MPTIDHDRLLADLTTLRSFGAQGTGVVRPTFSNADMAARRWLRERMEAAGLGATIDGVGNVVGRSLNPGPALLIGSHCDTQPQGGWLDGALGVIYAIEVANTLGQDPTTSHLAIDTVAWADEEGTYTSFLGSTSFVGELTEVEQGHANAAGETVTAALERVGLTTVERLHLERQRHVGYLEAHIEQGPHLEEIGLRIGVVTSIVGIAALSVAFTGEQNHAGTTPMARRRDAGVALFDFAVRLRERIAAMAGPDSVWTIGNARLEPGAESIIPGFAELTVQFRDPGQEMMEAIEAEIMALAEEVSDVDGVTVVAARRREPVAPAAMDPALRAHLASAAEAVVPGAWTEMASAAAHDAMIMTRHLPSAMLFIPSINGISHDFAENSSDTDITTGCQVLADAAVGILCP